MTQGKSETLHHTGADRQPQLLQALGTAVVLALLDFVKLHA
jgi:hypothetical protein